MLYSFIGNAVAVEQGVYMAPYHYKKLEIQRNIYLVESRGEFDYVMPTNAIIRRELIWWQETILESKRDILPPPGNITLYSDASMKAWGGHTVDIRSTGGD